jgi:hypothetical protein
MKPASVAKVRSTIASSGNRLNSAALSSAPLGRSGGEVPVAPGLRARAYCEVILPVDLVLDDRPAAEDLYDDPGPTSMPASSGCSASEGRSTREHAPAPSRHGDPPGLRLSCPPAITVTTARAGVALVGDDDRLVGVAPGEPVPSAQYQVEDTVSARRRTARPLRSCCRRAVVGAVP